MGNSDLGNREVREGELKMLGAFLDEPNRWKSNWFL
jgi:hypothetical protein